MGVLKTLSEYPSRGADQGIEFPRAGISRAEFVAEFHDDRPGNWPDGDAHAKSHHQQYYDHLKAKHYRNPFDLLACDSCHTPHDATNSDQLIGKAEDNTSCMRCHAPFPPFFLPDAPTGEQVAVSVEEHMMEYATMVSPYDPANALGLIDYSVLGYNPVNTPFLAGAGNCAGCHMPKTAKSQAQWTKENGRTGTIVRGEISSHQFDIIRLAVSAAMKLATPAGDVIPNSCGTCHNDLMGISPDLVP